MSLPVFDGLSYGWRTAILSVAVAQLLSIAVALLRPVQNRIANRALAALLVATAGVVTPWMIGFAGFYDKWQWLSFSPFSITLAICPLFYIYVYALTEGRAPRRMLLHLAPAILQVVYLSVCFIVLRQPVKNDFLGAQAPLYGFLTAAGVIGGCIAYGAASQKLLKRYRSELARQRSDDHRYAAEWISRSILALGVFLLAWIGFSIADMISPLGYRGFMGLYVVIAAFALYLAIEGWRHASLAFPPRAALVEAASNFAGSEETDAAGRNWSALGAEWQARVKAARWHADPSITIADLARRLGTNTGYLSRALNEGLGVNFSTFINGLRCEDVAQRLASGDRRDLLTLALEAGFSSKASFNRAFAARFGVTPSQYRLRAGSNPE